VNRDGESKAQGMAPTGGWRFREMQIQAHAPRIFFSVAEQCLQATDRFCPNYAITISCNHNNSVTSRFNITGDLSIQTNRGK